jgi:hypothetical protein
MKIPGQFFELYHERFVTNDVPSDATQSGWLLTASQNRQQLGSENAALFMLMFMSMSAHILKYLHLFCIVLRFCLSPRGKNETQRSGKYLDVRRKKEILRMPRSDEKFGNTGKTGGTSSKNIFSSQLSERT